MKPASQFPNVGHFICPLLVLLTLLVYLPVRHYPFVSYDDPVYVVDNRHVQAGVTAAGVQWAFTTGHAGNWHPVTWLSHMLDVQWFGAGASGPHLVNLFLHLANTVLLFIVLRRLTGALWRSAFVAALFALHPLHVESVAWIAERKDVLSGFLFLLTLWAYARYAQKRSRADYGVALLFFALGLMSKPMLVTLPFVLLLLDCWPLGRSRSTTGEGNGTLAWSDLIREKIPFFLLSAISCVVTFLVQSKGGAVQSLDRFTTGERIANAFVSYPRYLGKIFWPADLAVLYPHPGHWPAAQIALAVVLVVSLCVGAFWLGRRWPFVATGWFWFFGMLIPTIGLIQVGDQAMADRYTYLPAIGGFILLTWGAGEALMRYRCSKIAIAVAAGVVVAACAVGTRVQLSHWRDSESLFRHALAVTQKNFLAHNNLGNALLERHEVDEAIAQFQLSLKIKPDYANAQVNLGNALFEQGKLDEAIAQFETALRTQPDFAEAHYNLANVLLKKGETENAILHYGQASELDPDHVMAQNNLANALFQKGQWDDAIVRYRGALAIWPDFVMAHHNLGLALLQRQQTDEAVMHFRKIVELQPDSANVRNNLGWMLHQAGQFDEAVVHYREALAMQPDYAEAHDNLARTLVQRGEIQDALTHFRSAVKLQPNDPQNLSDLAWVLATWPDTPIRNGPEALELARRADQLSQSGNPAVLRTLAAALAETTQFAEAATIVQRALPLAESQSNAALIGTLRSQLKLYEARSPFREGPKSATQPSRLE
jgi:tetratricopeptide (TPR) repeat protein